MEKVVTAILGGGQGSRLWPLTRDRAKPAVPIGGKFRLIDIPISNSLHAGIDRIFVITQFNSASLHRHIAQTYRFGAFSLGFVNILAAEQTTERTRLVPGHGRRRAPDPAAAAGAQSARGADPLGRPALPDGHRASSCKAHRERGADLTIAVKPVTREEAPGFGILRLDPHRPHRRVRREAQGRPSSSTRSPSTSRPRPPSGSPRRRARYLASMGIYMFRPEVLRELLVGTTTIDFGREVIPQALDGLPGLRLPLQRLLDRHRHHPELPPGEPGPDAAAAAAQPLRSRAPDLHPPAFPARDQGQRSASSSARILERGEHPLRQPGHRLDHRHPRRGALAARSSSARSSWAPAPGRPCRSGSDQIPIGIGRDCHIRNAIVDFDARIGDGSKLINDGGVQNADNDNYCIRDGIIVVPKDAVIPAGHGDLRCRAAQDLPDRRRGHPLRQDGRTGRRGRRPLALPGAGEGTTCGSSSPSTPRSPGAAEPFAPVDFLQDVPVAMGSRHFTLLRPHRQAARTATSGRLLHRLPGALRGEGIYHGDWADSPALRPPDAGGLRVLPADGLGSGRPALPRLAHGAGADLPQGPLLAGTACSTGTRTVLTIHNMAFQGLVAAPARSATSGLRGTRTGSTAPTSRPGTSTS